MVPSRSVRDVLVIVGVILAALSGSGSVTAAPAILDVACEQIDAVSYRIDFTAAPGTGRVEIFASLSADRADSTKPVAAARGGPVVITVPFSNRRVYFHLRPEAGKTRVVATRQLPLEGANNFRDLGGYATTEGRFVRWGVVFRSDHLTALTARDYDYLASVGVKLVCDLRRPAERDDAPTRWVGQAPVFLHAPIGSGSGMPLARAMAAPFPPEEFKRRLAAAERGDVLPMGASYDRNAFEFASAYTQVFQQLIAGELPAVTHCSGGQDRTGLYSAMLLTMLGVPWNTVVEDYLLTAKYFWNDTVVGKQALDWQKEYGLVAPPSAAVVRRMTGPRVETLKATFDAIDRRYGSFDNYRRQALQIPDAAVARLRARLLDP